MPKQNGFKPWIWSDKWKTAPEKVFKRPLKRQYFREYLQSISATDYTRAADASHKGSLRQPFKARPSTMKGQSSQGLQKNWEL